MSNGQATRLPCTPHLNFTLSGWWRTLAHTCCVLADLRQGVHVGSVFSQASNEKQCQSCADCIYALGWRGGAYLKQGVLRGKAGCWACGLALRR